MLKTEAAEGYQVTGISRKDWVQKSSFFLPTEKSVILNNSLLPKVEQAGLVVPFSEGMEANIIHALRLTVEYARASNSASHRAAFEGMRQYRSENFPQGYDSLSAVLDAQKDTVGGSVDYLELAKKLRIEGSVPHDFHVHFANLAHAVFSPEEEERKRAFLKEEMSKVFTKDGINIVYAEDEKGDIKAHEELFNRKIKEFNSVVSAMFYINMYIFGGIELTYSEIQKLREKSAYDQMYKGLSPVNKYNQIFCQVIDGFYQEGYDIILRTERGSSFEPEDLENFKLNPENFKKLYLEMVSSLNERTQSAAYDINELELSTFGSLQRRNVFVGWGSLHRSIPDLLPKRFESVVTVSDEEGEDGKTVMDQVVNYLQNKKEIPEELWEKVYEECKVNFS